MSFSSSIAAVVMAAILVGVVRGQNDCASQLVPCAVYLNSTNPSTECCTAIKQVVATELQCLCGLLNNPKLVPGINMTQALELPRHCNLPSDTSRCKRGTGSAPGPLPNSSTLPPPARQDGNGSNRASWMGMPALLLVLALSFFHY